MTRRDEPIQPMTLGNMRRNGVRGLDVTCLHCGYHTAVNVDRWSDDVPVPSFGPRMRCTKCGKLGELDRATGQRARWPQLSAIVKSAAPSQDDQAGDASRRPTRHDGDTDVPRTDLHHAAAGPAWRWRRAPVRDGRARR